MKTSSAVLLLVLTVMLATLASTASASTSHCGFVGFEPNSSDLAWNVTGVRTTCQMAREVAGGSRPDHFRWGQPGYHPNESYHSHGFLCVGNSPPPPEPGMRLVYFRCAKGRQLVTFGRA